MTLRMPSNEFEPHSTPPGPVIISTRLISSIGCDAADRRHVDERIEQRQRRRAGTARPGPGRARAASGTSSGTMPTRCQPGTVSSELSRGPGTGDRVISSAVMTVTIAGASCTVVTPLAADCTMLARSSASSAAWPGSSSLRARARPSGPRRRSRCRRRRASAGAPRPRAAAISAVAVSLRVTASSCCALMKSTRSLIGSVGRRGAERAVGADADRLELRRPDALRDQVVERSLRRAAARASLSFAFCAAIAPRLVDLRAERDVDLDADRRACGS